MLEGGGSHAAHLEISDVALFLFLGDDSAAAGTVHRPHGHVQPRGRRGLPAYHPHRRSGDDGRAGKDEHKPRLPHHVAFDCGDDAHVRRAVLSFVGQPWHQAQKGGGFPSHRAPRQ